MLTRVLCCVYGDHLPVACQVSTSVRPRDLFLGLQSARFVLRLGKERRSELTERLRRVRVVSRDEGYESLLYRSVHDGYNLVVSLK